MDTSIWTATTVKWRNTQIKTICEFNPGKQVHRKQNRPWQQLALSEVSGEFTIVIVVTFYWAFDLTFQIWMMKPKSCLKPNSYINQMTHHNILLQNNPSARYSGVWQIRCVMLCQLSRKSHIVQNKGVKNGKELNIKQTKHQRGLAKTNS